MRTVIKFTLSVAILLQSAAIMAQSEKSGRPAGVRLSAGVETGLPTGKFNAGTRWNLGGSLQADINLASRVLYLTANAGYNNFYSAENSKDNLQLIPVKVGLKYFPVGQFYIQGEAGVAFVANKSAIDADKSAAFVFAPQLGYLIPLGGRNYLDAGIRFESNSKFYEQGSRANFFGLRLAYAFMTK